MKHLILILITLTTLISCKKEETNYPYTISKSNCGKIVSFITKRIYEKPDYGNIYCYEIVEWVNVKSNTTNNIIKLPYNNNMCLRSVFFYFDQKNGSMKERYSDYVFNPINEQFCTDSLSW